MSKRHTLAAVAGAVSVAALVVAFVLLRLSSEVATSDLTPAQASAVARLIPYKESLSRDFELGMASLPADFVRSLEAAPDGLSATGLIGILVGDGTCAALRVDFGPMWLLEEDPLSIAVSSPVLVPERECEGSAP